MTDRQSGQPESGDLESLVASAALAPSSHNTQPWRFAITKNSIHLYADRTRALPVNDPDDRELVISCGCALLNLRVAAAQACIPLSIEILPNGQDRDLLATARFEQVKTKRKEPTGLHAAMAGRRTCRKRFKESAVPESVSRDLAEAGSVEGVRLEVVTSNAIRKEIASLVEVGDSVQWANPNWRRELAAWMHSRRDGDGLPIPGLFAPLVRTVVRGFDMGNWIGTKDKRLAEESPVLAVLGTESDDVDDWIRAGQGLQRVLLAAHRHEMQASYLNQPVQVSTLRPKLQHLIYSAGCPQIVLRIGYPRKIVSATPRRQVREILEKNE